LRFIEQDLHALYP